MRFPSNWAQHSMARRAEKHDIGELKLQGHGTGRKNNFSSYGGCRATTGSPSHFPCLFHRVETSHDFAAKDIAGKPETKLQVEAWGMIWAGVMGDIGRTWQLCLMLWIHFSTADPHCWVNKCALALFNINMFCPLVRAPGEFRPGCGFDVGLLFQQKVGGQGTLRRVI